jgi:hypothetical protein
MFEHLKAGSGNRTKERTRLWGTVAACLVLGTAIYGGKSGCAGDAEQRTPTAVEKRRELEKKAPAARELDRSPLLPLADRPGSGTDFDATALDYVVSEVRKGDLVREPWKKVTPAEALALDPKEAIGRTLETRGTIRRIDREERDLPHTPAGTGRLWAFALEGEDGKQIAVVHPGSSQEMDEGRPRAAIALPGSGQGPTLQEGAMVLVRGVYLQRRAGTIARVALDGPTPVLVGREYRFTEPPNPTLESPEQAAFGTIEDRFLKGMRSVDSEASRQIIQWAQSVGHEEIQRRIKSGEWKAQVWLGEEFGRWRKEMAAERDASQPDKREWAPAQRGKLFRTPGVFGDFLQEDWDQVPPNAQGIDRRWKLYLLSDYDGYLTVVFDSPFPVTAFPGITGRKQQRVMAYGIFVQAHTFEVKGKTKEGEIQSPYFVLMDLRPLDLPTGTPILQNPFFWTWVSLAVFGAVFFFVMSRIERKERTAMDAQHLRIRRRQRELGQSVGAPPPKGTKADAGTKEPSPPAGEGGPGSPP